MISLGFPGGFNFSGFHDPNDIFAQMFGRNFNFSNAGGGDEDDDGADRVFYRAEIFLIDPVSLLWILFWWYPWNVWWFRTWLWSWRPSQGPSDESRYPSYS